MMDAKLRDALERRYDGPIPVGASAPPDYDRPWRQQLRSRKRGSWQDVRRLGRLAARARHAFHASDAGKDRDEWMRLRRNLAFALKSWAAFRDRLQRESEYAAGDDTTPSDHRVLPI